MRLTPHQTRALEWFAEHGGPHSRIPKTVADRNLLRSLVGKGLLYHVIPDDGMIGYAITREGYREVLR